MGQGEGEKGEGVIEGEGKQAMGTNTREEELVKKKKEKENKMKKKIKRIWLICFLLAIQTISPNMLVLLNYADKGGKFRAIWSPRQLFAHPSMWEKRKKSKKNLHLDSKREATDQLYFALFILVDFFANEYE